MKHNQIEGPKRFDEYVVAAVGIAGAALVIVSVVISSATISACGPCWPGPCVDATATPTPTPTATPNPECTLGRDTDLISADLWQADTSSCPRLLLDATDPNYDSDELCEVGGRTDGDDTTFVLRYDCNASDAWMLAAAVPGTVTVDGIDVTSRSLSKACPSEVAQSENFLNGKEMEPVLWERDGVEVAEVTAAWEEGCASSEATDERLSLCSQVCGGTLPLREALADAGIETTSAVDCYLALYDTLPPHDGTATLSTDEQFEMNTLCACVPNTFFLDCVSQDCLTGTTYDTGCGEICWVMFPTSSGECRLP
ncbi:MAG: hypothetical protein P8R42_18925 [Candidatus Binatia bacterium]|nr:hypothetical protein [Candidatus Binatia bacterium]